MYLKSLITGVLLSCFKGLEIQDMELVIKEHCVHDPCGQKIKLGAHTESNHGGKCESDRNFKPLKTFNKFVINSTLNNFIFITFFIQFKKIFSTIVSNFN